MQQISTQLMNLLNSPKKSTANLQHLCESMDNFFPHLIQLSLNHYRQNLMLQNLALTCFTTLSIRKLKQAQHVFGLLDEIVGGLKQISLCGDITFRQKKQQIGRLVCFVCELKIVEELKNIMKELFQAGFANVNLLYLEGVMMSSLNSLQKIDMAVEFFAQTHLPIARKITVLEEPGASDLASVESFLEVEQWVKIVVFINKLFRTINQEYEYRAMQYIYENQLLINNIYHLLYLNHREYWLLCTHQQLDPYILNKLKAQVIEILIEILRKTDPNYNMCFGQWACMKRVPELCVRVMEDLGKVGGTKMMDDNYATQLCEGMHGLLSECVMFKDLELMFQERIDGVRDIILPFLGMKETERELSNDEPLDFVLSVESIGEGPLEQRLMKSQITKLILAFYDKINGFATSFVHLCVINLYQQFNLPRPPPIQPDLPHLTPYASFMGLLMVSRKLSHRKDLVQMIKTVLSLIQLDKISPVEKLLLFKLFSSMRFVLLDGKYGERYQGMVEHILSMDEEDEVAFLGGVDLLKVIISLPTNKQIELLQKQVWEGVLLMCFHVKNYYFFQIFGELFDTSDEELSSATSTSQIRIVQACTKRLLKLHKTPHYDELLFCKVFNLNSICIEHMLSRWQQIEGHAQRGIVQLLLLLIDDGVDSDTLSRESKDALVELCGSLLNHKMKVEVNKVLKKVVNFIITYPYGEGWVTCVCEYVVLHGELLQQGEMRGLKELVTDSVLSKDEKILNQACIIIITMVCCGVHYEALDIHPSISSILFRNLHQQQLYNITIVRLTHVFLCGVHTDSAQCVQILQQHIKYIECYSTEEVSLMMKLLQNLQLGGQVYKQVLRMVIEVLHKLHMAPQHYGKESKEEKRLRGLIRSVDFMSKVDPFAELREIYGSFLHQGYDMKENYQVRDKLGELLKVYSVQGQPRILYTIKRYP